MKRAVKISITSDAETLALMKHFAAANKRPLSWAFEEAAKRFLQGAPPKPQATGRAERSAEQERLFKASGSVELTGKLEALLYLLMRDHVQPGVMGDLMRDLSAAGAGRNSYTNGWLARYAEYLAGELRTGEELTSEGAAKLAAMVGRPGRSLPKLAAKLKGTAVRRWSDAEVSGLMTQVNRAEQKAASRAEDERALKAGEKTPDELRKENAHFARLKVKRVGGRLS